MQENPDKIFFYEREFYPLSNFSSFAVEWEGELWMTSEHVYQASKFTDPLVIGQIKEAKSAHDAFKIARANEDKVRPEWLDIRISVMEKIVRTKFEQHPYVQRKLRETGNKEIIEDSWRD
ncbi:MAG: NADAR family protein, partial [Nanoarchaeota archaeon]